MSTIDPLSLPAAPQSAAAKTSNNADAFGKDAIMKLLVEQMRHQSPTDPADGQAWINQMTQFSMLEQMQQQSAGQVKANAASYLGTTVPGRTPRGSRARVSSRRSTSPARSPGRGGRVADDCCCLLHLLRAWRTASSG